jgi:tRNA pseudouridine synthase 10
MNSFSVCAFCLNRLGKPRILKMTKDAECAICEGLFSKVRDFAIKINRDIKSYDFSSFSIGVKISPQIQEREDEVKSILKLHGTPSIKTHFLKELLKELKIEISMSYDSDLFILIDTAKGTVQYTPKPVYFYGRYTKPASFSQRIIPCRFCNTQGCDECGNTGEVVPSVENVIRNKLLQLTEGKRVKITWFGRDELESVVYPPGRPFIAEIKEPKKRNISKVHFSAYSGKVEVTGSFFQKRPETPRICVTFRILIDGEIKCNNTKIIEDFFLDREVSVMKKNGNKVTKKVYWVKFKNEDHRKILDVEMDMGIPPRRFVEGSIVSPSISEILKGQVRCQKFDILKVRLVN